jgi:hypothetical protein
MYSQQHEDDIFVPLLPERGRFLEIGAFHPKCFSNSRALWEKGWGGVLIEPSPGPLKELVKEYGGLASRVQVVCGAVGAGGPGEMQRLRLTDDAVSGNIDPAWDEKGGFYGYACYPQISIGWIKLHFGAYFDFLSIDTEGTSFSILREWMLLTGKNPRPRAIVCEHNYKYAEIAAFMKQYDYRTVHVNDCNIILARNL